MYDCNFDAAGTCGGTACDIGGAGDDEVAGEDEPKRLGGEGEAAADMGAGEGVEPKRPSMSSTADFFGAADLGAGAAEGVASLDELPKISARRSWLL